ncbi:isopentenyldiphosphate isomerase [Bacillus pakistanensis]|uniref:Isopentenyldiphosphate isomerase n=1 Tax=Rossellomorea pakistanensis TaxID=992288 RepID=A0ABS2N7B8_9BACI|nr:NUDIX domain-containing protein [Bacillus pakistanensis]MBM7583747.1 isopentenyldiphosphate isomerase [Bacillus pakistanensis]
MKEEWLKVFDEKHQYLRNAIRSEVHQKGLWHETFQCWIVAEEDDVHYLYFQIRSNDKKDFPNMLDITAAGHLLENESIEDGVREIDEEIGVSVTFDELVYLGVIKNQIRMNDFIDNEHSHVYLLNKSIDWDDFRFRDKEVSGIMRANLDELKQFLFDQNVNTFKVDGFIVKDNKQEFISKIVDMSDLVPHNPIYFKILIHSIENAIREGLK